MRKKKLLRDPALSHLSPSVLELLRDYGRAVANDNVPRGAEQDREDRKEKESLAFSLGLHLFRLTPDEALEMRKGFAAYGYLGRAERREARRVRNGL